MPAAGTLAEALLDAGDLEGAAEALRRSAREMETDQWPLADRMRRLRVEGLLHAESGQHEEALQTSTLALEMAQMASIDRYELVLLDDIARMHLESGTADEAAVRYRALADRARRTPNSGLTLSNALVGLVAALTAKNDLDEAETRGARSVAAVAAHQHPAGTRRHRGVFDGAPWPAGTGRAVSRCLGQVPICLRHAAGCDGATMP